MYDCYQCPSCGPCRQQANQELDNWELMNRQATVPACPNGFLYTVVPGDTMFLISRRFNVNLDALVRANPQVNPAQLMVGQRICVPTGFVPAHIPEPPLCPGGFYYTVQSGDTLTAIAARNNVTLAEMLRANPQINPNLLMPGQRLCVPRRVPVPTPTPIPVPSIPTPTPTPTPIPPVPTPTPTPPPSPNPTPNCPGGYLYTVTRGDTMSGIAQRFDLSMQDLLRANPQLPDPSRLNVGDRICIPLPIPEPPATCSGTLYTVRKGESLTAIAQRANLTVEALLQANPQISDVNVIFTGQVICIPQTARTED